MRRQIWVGSVAATFAWGFVTALLALSIWQRKPPGRGTAINNIIKVKGLPEFDQVNPSAPEDIRDLFCRGLVAHMENDFASAELSYKAVLQEMPNESTTVHNLKVLRSDRESG